MTRPDVPVEIPTAVTRLAGTAEIVPVWLNQLGGLTFRADSVYIKWSSLDNDDIDLSAEADKLRWASAHTRVPEVVESGSDADSQWLVTMALPGKSAVDARWIRAPAVAARAIGQGLRAFHDTVPTQGCPYEWSVASRVAAARERGLAVDLAVPIGEPPPLDQVVCHGDACAPNTLLDDSGRWSGHVDLGSLGLADRWADLAPAIMSTEWNYGRRLTSEILDGYGIGLDQTKLDFYCRLWNET